MALYKYSQFLTKSESDVFDQVYDPGTATPHSGIYRCNVCAFEVASIQGRPLPPPSDSNHAAWTITPHTVKWRLEAYAVHKRG